MINCQYLKDNCCEFASSLANTVVSTSPEACRVCVNHIKPKQLNNVTASLVLYTIKRPIPEDKRYLLKEVQITKFNYVDGPGTELIKLVSWFKFTSKKCRCKERALKMNKWGPDGCEQRMSTILRWLRHAAFLNNVPYNKSLVKIVVQKAIRNARNKQLVVHSNDST